MRQLTHRDRDEALDLCARDPASHVFVASRIVDGDLDRGGPLVGVRDGAGRLTSLCWTGANIVPVETDEAARHLLADRLRRRSHQTASILGRAPEALDLWRRLEPHWPTPRSVRAAQLLLSLDAPPSVRGIEPDPRVRPAVPSEVPIVRPAAVDMFTGEIGYPPYTGSDRAYTALLADLVSRGRTYVVVEDGRVIFKADVGSVALGCAQVQGVWLAPELRGAGRSVGLMAAVCEQVARDHAPLVTLYVNEYNHPARALYARLGFRLVGPYATILM